MALTNDDKDLLRREAKAAHEKGATEKEFLNRMAGLGFKRNTARIYYRTFSK